jgi:hypothetical protein
MKLCEHGYTDRYPNGHCRPCQRAIQRAWEAANRDKVRARQRARNTGWTPEMVDFAWDLQEGKCGICEEVLPNKQKAQSDHCHDTDKRRWLLCVSCNTLEGGIRKFRAKGHSLQRIDDYLLLPGVEDIMARRSVRGDINRAR